MVIGLYHIGFYPKHDKYHFLIKLNYLNLLKIETMKYKLKDELYKFKIKEHERYGAKWLDGYLISTYYSECDEICNNCLN